MNINHSKESLILLIEQLKIKLAEKEEENRHLRARAYDWKKKALENESLYQTLIKQYEEHEKQMISDHENQMNALTTAHVEKMNDMSTLVLKLQEQLDQYSSQRHSYNHDHLLSLTSYSNNTLNDISQKVEDINTSSNAKVIHHRHKATDLILNMNDLMVDIETRINDYIAINHLQNEDSNDDFETSTSSEDEDEDHTYDIEENINPSTKTRPLSLSSATSFISSSSPQCQQQNDKEEAKGKKENQVKEIIMEQHQYSYHDSKNNYNDDDVHSYASSIHNYPSTNELYEKKNRSSFSLFSSNHQQQQQQQHQQQQQQQQQQSNPILQSKSTMEHLSKVIPNFLLKKPIKSEQWKISHRHSFIDKRF